MSDELLIEGGRSVGEVDVPDVHPKLPAITDEEIEDASESLHLHKFSAKRLKSLRLLGQAQEASGVVSVGRGILLYTTEHLMGLFEEAKDFVATGDCADENSLKAMSLRKEIAHELNGVARTLLESEESQKSHRPPPPNAYRLPAAREQITPDQLPQQAFAIKGDLHIHQK